MFLRVLRWMNAIVMNRGGNKVMTRTITEKYEDGKLVERVIVEDELADPQWIPPVPILTDDPWPSPWWGIIPPPRFPYGKSTETTANLEVGK